MACIRAADPTPCVPDVLSPPAPGSGRVISMEVGDTHKWSPEIKVTPARSRVPSYTGVCRHLIIKCSLERRRKENGFG